MNALKIKNERIFKSKNILMKRLNLKGEVINKF